MSPHDWGVIGPDNESAHQPKAGLDREQVKALQNRILEIVTECGGECDTEAAYYIALNLGPSIAQAPAMLEALRALVAVYDRVGGPLAVDPAVAECRAVLAAVEGDAK